MKVAVCVPASYDTDPETGEPPCVSVKDEVVIDEALMVSLNVTDTAVLGLTAVAPLEGL